MAISRLPIANGAYTSGSLPISAQDCTNWFPRVIESAGLNQEVLIGTPGITGRASSGDFENTCRGAFNLEGTAYLVNGIELIRVNPDYSLDVIGEIEGENRVSMASNGRQLCIMVPGGKGYIFTEDPDDLQEITDPDFRASGNPQLVVFIDGYFVFTTDSKKFIVSALNDGLSYNAVDFGSAEADPDDIVAPIVFNNQLFIGGSETLEAFQNIGGADFPFRRTGVFIPKGVDAPFSIINSDNGFMFIGGGKNEKAAVWQSTGSGAPRKVSTIAIDRLIQEAIETENVDIFAFSYAEEGSYFVGFSLNTTSIVYDTISGRWHERKSDIINSFGQPQTIRWRVNSLTEAYGTLIVGDVRDGRIGTLDKNTYTEYDRNIVRTVTTQPFQIDMQSFLVPMVELTVESGVGNKEVPDPVITMQRSVDGKTWSDGRRRSIGKVGEYKRRAIWRRNGRASRFEIFRFILADAVKPVIIQLTADIRG